MIRNVYTVSPEVPVELCLHTQTALSLRLHPPWSRARGIRDLASNSRRAREKRIPGIRIDFGSGTIIVLLHLAAADDPISKPEAHVSAALLMRWIETEVLDRSKRGGWWFYRSGAANQRQSACQPICWKLTPCFHRVAIRCATCAQ